MRQSKYQSIAIAVALTLVLAIATGVIVFWAVKPASAKTQPGKDDPVMDLIPGRTNVLIMGVDLREGDTGRSDAMVMASIDSKGQPFLLSIPRDTRAKISGYGYDKINAAFAYGGAELAVETVSDFLGVPIQDYVVVNIDAFKQIVGVLGGVTLDVEKRMYYEDPYQDLIIDLQPGVQKLDGEDAMGYVRFRHDEMGDIGRVERQQKFIKAVAKEAFSLRNITKLPGFIRECYNAIDTDLSTTQMIKLATTGAKAYEKGLTIETLPGEPAYIGEISYYLPDVTATRELVAARILTGLNLTTYLAQGERQADEYEASVLAEEAEGAVVDNDDPPTHPNETGTPSGSESDPDTKPGTKPGTKPSDPGQTDPKPNDPGTTNPTDPTPDDPQPPVKPGLRIEIFDASGRARASVVSQSLREMGFSVAQAITTEQTQNTSTVIVYTQDASVASKLKAALPQAQIVPGGTNSSGVLATIIIGKDL